MMFFVILSIYPHGIAISLMGWYFKLLAFYINY